MADFFYVSISLLVVTSLYVIFLCPESRKPTAQTQQAPSTNDSTTPKTFPSAFRQTIKRFLSALMIPIIMFAPRRMPGRPAKKNYNLTLLGLGLFIYLVSTVSPPCSLLFGPNVAPRRSTKVNICMHSMLTHGRPMRWEAYLNPSNDTHLRRHSAGTLHVPFMDHTRFQSPGLPSQ